MTFEEHLKELTARMKRESYEIHTSKWQGIKVSHKPEAAMKELLNVSLTADMPTEDLDYYRSQIGPSIPWADDHFEERVCGEPLNPGVQWAKWPWGNSANAFRDEQGQFNHNYMERYWPKYAGMTDKGELTGTFCDPQSHHFTEDPNRKGIRYHYGDLGDLPSQLVNDALTRQCYLPVWFPEDTGVIHGGRVPCSLGYHFIMRMGRLHCVYYLRSCDLYRHLRDDLYLTVRLMLWMLQQCRKVNRQWLMIKPGTLTTHITSLHIFKNDFQVL